MSATYFKITVEEITPPNEGEKYPQTKEIYKQMVESLDLKKIILAVNDISIKIHIEVTP